MFTFLLVIHAIVAASLVAVILMQRSEGGGLGMGGSPSGLMSARGAADFLTRATTILATIFVVMSIGLATYAGMQRASRPIDTSLARPAGTPVPGDAVPLGDPLAGAAATVAGNVSAPGLPATAAVTAATPAPAAAEPAGKAAERAVAKTAAPRVIERESAVPTKLRLPASPTPATTSPLPAPKADSTPNTPSTTTPAPASAPAGGNNSVPLAQ